MTLTLADPWIRPTSGGHAYVLSGPLDAVTLPALARHFDDGRFDVTGAVGAEELEVRSLTDETRSGFETALREALIAANRARGEAEVIARRGAEFGETGAQRDADAKAAVEESFAQLPPELPHP